MMGCVPVLYARRIKPGAELGFFPPLFFFLGGGYFKQHAKIHHYPGALPPGWVGLAQQQGKRDKYRNDTE
jgi:hypothetical protein